jgi:hypothetical protein
MERRDDEGRGGEMKEMLYNERRERKRFCRT